MNYTATDFYDTRTVYSTMTTQNYLYTIGNIGGTIRLLAFTPALSKITERDPSIGIYALSSNVFVKDDSNIYTILDSAGTVYWERNSFDGSTLSYQNRKALVQTGTYSQRMFADDNFLHIVDKDAGEQECVKCYTPGGTQKDKILGDAGSIVGDIWGTGTGDIFVSREAVSGDSLRAYSVNQTTGAYTLQDEYPGTYGRISYLPGYVITVTSSVSPELTLLAWDGSTLSLADTHSTAGEVGAYFIGADLPYFFMVNIISSVWYVLTYRVHSGRIIYHGRFAFSPGLAPYQSGWYNRILNSLYLPGSNGKKLQRWESTFDSFEKVITQFVPGI